MGRLEQLGYKPGRPRPALVIPTPEEAAAKRAASDKLMADFIEKAGWNKPRDPLAKLKDREARVAVEGDTDLNHDNVEGAE